MKLVLQFISAGVIGWVLRGNANRNLTPGQIAVIQNVVLTLMVVVFILEMMVA